MNGKNEFKKEGHPLHVDHRALLTYEDLKRSHQDTLLAAEVRGQQIRNQISSLSRFMKYLGRTEEDPCSDDFGSNFLHNLDDYILWSQSKGLAQSTVTNSVSHLRKIEKTAQNITGEDGLPETFREALGILVERSELSKSMIAQSCGLDCKTLRDWIKGKYAPSEKSRAVVRELERIFSIPSGILQKRFTYNACGSHKGLETGNTDFGRKQQKLCRDHYRYKNPHENIKDEWRHLVNFYTAPFFLDDKERNSKWRVKSKRLSSDYQDKWFAQAQGGVCSAAAIKWKMVSSFFGFLLLSEDRGGVGLREDGLSLVLLSDASQVVRYIDFRKARSGCYTGEVYAFLKFCATLLRKKTGYLRQLPEMGQRMLNSSATPAWEKHYGSEKDELEKDWDKTDEDRDKTDEDSDKTDEDSDKTDEDRDKTDEDSDKTDEDRDKTKKDWDKFCEKNRKKILKVAEQLKKGCQIKKGRDPVEPISGILNNQHPIDVLWKMIKTMEREQCQIISEKRRALHIRDIVLIKMLTINPLRRHHYSIMTYKKNEGGNVIQRSDGSWALHFEAEDFKNQNGAAHGPYDVILSKSIWKQLEEYLSTYRRVLFCAEECDYLFLSIRDSKHDGMWPADSLTKRVKVLTQRYIPHCPGFGPHGFRHIVATEYLKNNPNGYQVVANILHDKLKTVLREYAHLKTADGFSHWTSYLDSRIEKVERGLE